MASIAGYPVENSVSSAMLCDYSGKLPGQGVEILFFSASDVFPKLRAEAVGTVADALQLGSGSFTNAWTPPAGYSDCTAWVGNSRGWIMASFKAPEGSPSDLCPQAIAVAKFYTPYE